MSTQIHPTKEEVLSIRQTEPPIQAEPPIQTPLIQAEPIQAEPPIEAPPIPPRGGIVARIQRMPPGGRWALGLAFAFLSATVLWSLSGAFMFSHSVAFLGALALALAAGVVLPSWRAGIALVGAMIAGGAVGSIALAVFSPGGVEGQTGITAILIALAFFALVKLTPLIILAVAGIGLGKTLGLTLGQPHALSTREATTSRWIAALFPVIAAGLLAPQLGNLPGMLGMQNPSAGALELMPGIAYAIALSLACLLAGWLLRSWLGFLITVIVYVAAATLIFTSGMGGGILLFASLGVWLYIVLPAAVMSAVGTLLGIWRAGRARQPA